MRGVPSLLAVALLLGGLAGCLTDNVDVRDDRILVPGVLPELYDAFEILPLDFTATDGTTIAAHVYLPKGAPEGTTFGTIVNLSPYYGNLYRMWTDGRLAAVTAGRIELNQSSTGIFLAHGFAYVAASVPGTGRSGGCFEIGGLHEQQVMAEFIDWVGEQDWSNGNVGMHGASYDGTTQWMVAIHAPEHLKTIVPWVSITDMYEYEYQDGAPYTWWGPFFLPYYLLEVGWGLNPWDLGMNARPQADLLTEDACPEALDQFSETAKAYKTGVYTDFWQERNYAARLGDINASVFLIHGLQDWNVKPLHSDVWDLIPTEKFAWLQQMRHNVPWSNSHEKEWVRDDYNATLLAWYDHYLNGAQNGIPDLLPPAWVQDNTGMWRNESAWPPQDTKTLRLHVGDKTLTTTAPPAGTTMIVTPPSWYEVDPVGLPFDTDALGMPFGPEGLDQVTAKFLTEQLEQPLRVSGVPKVILNVTVDRPGYGHLVAQLYTQHADGTYTFLDMGGRGLAQREGRERDDAVRPNERMTVPVELNPADFYLEAGERLLLLVTADDPDWFNYNGDTPTVWIEHGSSLELPVLPDDRERGIDSAAFGLLNPFYLVDPKEY